MDSEVPFGLWLKRRRKALDLTQDALARRVGCSLATIQKIEADERRPSRQIAELLAAVLEIPPRDRETFLKVARGKRRADRLPLAAPPVERLPGVASLLRPTNLPTPPTPLVGREGELAALAQLLGDPECRLLTLVGPGGIGKTRLAIESAAAQREAFGDGAYFVALAPLGAAEFIVPAIADALGFSFYGPTDPQSQLLNYLGEKTLLLVLDNIEHLLDGVAWLADALQHARDLKLLVTSRERLNLLGEWVFEIQGLPVPPADQAEGVDEYSAVALFVQSARRAKAGFVLRAEERPAVARICRLVEGTPLAIELAATWLQVLSCQEIAQEIERNLDFLAASARGLLERHRSMRAVFDHSWKLLTEDEQRALSQLSVFRGGFTREAAGQVAGVTLPVLSALASKSLLHPAGPERYDLHELMRQYAAGRLQADPDERATARERHYAFYLAQAEAARRGLRGPRQLEWLERLEQEHDNLRAALDWSLAAAATSGDHGDRALWLAGALRWFWHIHGHYHEGRGWLLKALHTGPESRAGDLRAQARALEGVAWLTNALGDHGAARSAAEASAALFRELGDQRGLAGALLVAGQAMAWQGEGALSHARLAEALALYREAGDRWNVARALSSLGFVLADWLGDRAGRAMLEESAAILEELGDRVFIANILISLGILATGSGDYASARARLEQALTVYRELGYPWGIADALTHLGCVARTQGEYGAARAYLEEALRIYPERGSNVWRADPLCALAENDLAQGDLPAARSRLQEAAALAASSENRWLQTLVGYFLGLVAYYEGDNERAAARLDETAALARDGRYQPDLARSLVALGRTRRAQGDAVQAAALFRQGLSLFGELGHRLGVAAAFDGLAGLAAADDARRAAQWFGAAEAIREAIGAPIPPVDRPFYERDVAAVRAQLAEAAFAQAWAEGRTLAMESAIGLAISSQR